jgi:hypothetical protein
MCEHKYDEESDVRYVDLGVFVKDWKALDRRLSMTDETNACILCGRADTWENILLDLNV